MKVWSLIYVVSVQSVSVQYMKWNLISWYTRTTNSFAVVCVVKILNIGNMLYDTLRDVPPSVNMCVDVYDWVCRELTLHCCRQCTGKILEFRVVDAEISGSADSWLRVQTCKSFQISNTSAREVRRRRRRRSLFMQHAREVTVEYTQCLDVVSRLC